MTESKVKKIGDKELELMILRYVAEHDNPKESEICQAIPARTLRVAEHLRQYCDRGVLAMEYSETSYTVKRYHLTEFGEFCLSIKEADCATLNGNFKFLDCAELDLKGKDLRTMTLMLQAMVKKK